MTLMEMSFLGLSNVVTDKPAGGTGALNGIKSLMLSGLVNSTTYKVWVNATDPAGSGLYTREWYVFTTKVNQPSYFWIANSIQRFNQ